MADIGTRPIALASRGKKGSRNSSIGGVIMKIHHLAFRSRTPRALADFYGRLLDLRIVREQEGYSLWLDLETALLMIEQAEPTEPQPSAESRELVAFAVDRKTRERVEARLAELEVALEERGEYTSYFRDPEGRRLAVSSYPLQDFVSG